MNKLTFDTQQLFDFLLQQPLFDQVDTKIVQKIAEIVDVIILPKGGIIFHENELSRDLYFIYEGDVELLKKDINTGRQIAFASLKKADVLGEMALIDAAPRSSTVRAPKSVVFLKCSLEMLQERFSKDIKQYNQFLFNITLLNINRLRNTNETYVQSLRSELDFLKYQNDAGRFLLFVFFLFSLANSFNYALKYFQFDSNSILFYLFNAFIIFLPCLGFIKWLNYPLKNFGLTLKGWRPILIESLVITGSLIMGITLLYFFKMINFHKVITETLPFRDHHLFQSQLIYVSIYFAYVCLSEFIGRGMILSFFQRFLNDSKGLLAVLSMSIFLVMVQPYIGLVNFILSFISNVILGLAFIRQRSLLGVILIHFLVGCFIIYL